MERRNQIELIFSIAEKDFSAIGELYKKAIKQKKIDNLILVRIKNYLENLRSILDFLAHEICEKYCTKEVVTYFPILRKTSSENDIDNSINGRLPNLKENNIQMFEYLKSLQPTHENNQWLQELNDLCNTNKHKLLTLQIRKNEIFNKLSFENGHSYIWSDALVKFESFNKVNVSPMGKFSINNDCAFSEVNDYIFDIGWIATELKNHKIRSLPDLSKFPKDSYLLNSYIIGNFYFPDYKQNVYTKLELYLNKVYEIYQKTYELL